MGFGAEASWTWGFQNSFAPSLPGTPAVAAPNVAPWWAEFDNTAPAVPVVAVDYTPESGSDTDPETEQQHIWQLIYYNLHNFVAAHYVFSSGSLMQLVVPVEFD